MPNKELFLKELHESYGAKFVDFANIKMPIFYKNGILQEHAHTRSHAGVFDISHMGQIIVKKTGSISPDALLETLCPADIQTLQPGCMRYTQLLNEHAGVIDDIMVMRDPEQTTALIIIVNGACKYSDYEFFATTYRYSMRYSVA